MGIGISCESAAMISHGWASHCERILELGVALRDRQRGRAKEAWSLRLWETSTAKNQKHLMKVIGERGEDYVESF